MERSVTFTLRGSPRHVAPFGNHESNMRIVDSSPLRVSATWAFHSIDVTVGDRAVFFAFGPLLERVLQDPDSEFEVVKTHPDAEAVRAELGDEGALVNRLVLYACYSGKLTAGRCDCVGVEAAWEGMTAMGPPPTVTLDLDYHGLEGASTVEELATELKKISNHYYMACENNPVFVSVVERS